MRNHAALGSVDRQIEEAHIDENLLITYTYREHITEVKGGSFQSQPSCGHPE